MNTKEDMYWHLGLALSFAIIAFFMTQHGEGPVAVLCAVVPTVWCLVMAFWDILLLTVPEDEDGDS